MGFTLHVPDKQARMASEALLSQALDGMHYLPTPPVESKPIGDDDLSDDQPLTD